MSDAKTLGVSHPEAPMLGSIPCPAFRLPGRPSAPPAEPCILRRRTAKASVPRSKTSHSSSRSGAVRGTSTAARSLGMPRT